MPDISDELMKRFIKLYRPGVPIAIYALLQHLKKESGRSILEISPKDMHKILRIDHHHACDAVKDLEKMDLIKYLRPKDSKGRFTKVYIKVN